MRHGLKFMHDNFELHKYVGHDEGLNFFESWLQLL